jgi:ankyrin repeat protein
MSDPNEQTQAAPALDPETAALAPKLFDLAREGETAQLAQYLDKGIPATLTNESGDTLVMLAAYYAHPETVALLLERGGDPNQANDKGQTPLAGAVFKGQAAIVRALLAAGADPQAGFPSAIDTARMFGQADLLALFESA